MYRIININDFSKNEYDAYFEMMTQDRQKKVSRFRFDEDKKRSVFAEMLAKEMISEKLGVPIESIVIKTDENGKPFAQGLDIHFNISHSSDLVICALNDKPIGVDIEEIREVKNKLIDFVCTENEKSFVQNSEFEKPKRFFEIWTAKEAYFKFLGSGITDIKSINTLSDEFKKHLESFEYENYIISIYS